MIFLLISSLVQSTLLRPSPAQAAPYMNLTSSQATLYLAYSAYCGTNVDVKFDCYWCKFYPGAFEFIGDFGHGNSSLFGFVDDLAGWIIDAEFDQIQLPFAPSGVAVHQGFSNDFNGSISAVAVLLQAAQAACASCSNLIVSGHSLGGGLALLSAAYLATQNKMGFATMRLQTYGAPRVGNPAFASWYATLNVPTQRMTWHRDCVPRLPWRNTLFLWKYHHVAYELFFNGTGYHMCDSSGEDANCIDRYLIENPLDHALYMNHDLLDGIVHGCLYTDPMVSMGVQALVDLVDDDAN